ncbi:hypothetical protein ON010_g16992 [Phytophthora cinnamomi]|nr:hypothetical protein ON010_g16992 [Phytophthora cinnamomi]
MVMIFLFQKGSQEPGAVRGRVQVGAGGAASAPAARARAARDFDRGEARRALARGGGRRYWRLPGVGPLLERQLPDHHVPAVACAHQPGARAGRQRVPALRAAPLQARVPAAGHRGLGRRHVALRERAAHAAPVAAEEHAVPLRRVVPLEGRACGVPPVAGHDRRLFADVAPDLSER